MVVLGIVVLFGLGLGPGIMVVMMLLVLLVLLGPFPPSPRGDAVFSIAVPVGAAEKVCALVALLKAGAFTTAFGTLEKSRLALAVAAAQNKDSCANIHSIVWP